jgi:hypothetical protein
MKSGKAVIAESLLRRQGAGGEKDEDGEDP